MTKRKLTQQEKEKVKEMLVRKAQAVHNPLNKITITFLNVEYDIGDNGHGVYVRKASGIANFIDYCYAYDDDGNSSLESYKEKVEVSIP